MRVLSFGVLIMCSACFPMRAIVRRPQGGTVVDARTGAPIQGARVVVESWQVQAPPGNMAYRWLLHTVETKTDGMGRWHVDEEKDWKWAVLAADGFPVFTDSGCVEAAGYEPAVVNPWRSETAALPQAVRDDIVQTRIPAVFRLASGQGRVVGGDRVSPCGVFLKGSGQTE